jgi:3-methylfumaryl-CoA hydratase
VSLLDAATLAHLQSWQGKTEHRRDQLVLNPVRAMSATLDREDGEPLNGDALPHLWHWLYFLPLAKQREIGPDGHPKRGGFLPPVPLPRRMWAGGRLQWHQPMHLGEEVQRISTIEKVQHKTGRSGELLFVQVLHTFSNAQGVCLEETHDIVFRPEADPNAPPMPGVKPVHTAVWQRDIVPDDVLLFRYSALTFNSHRIHYDRQYVTEVEKYPGLLVHGPLTQTLLLDLFRREHPGVVLKEFNVRAVSPLYDIYDFTVEGAPDGDGKAKLWALNHEGRLAMSADAVF